jgi:hypothetical protein
MEERLYSSYFILDLGLDGGEWIVSDPSSDIPPGKGHLVPIAYEAGRASEMVWTQTLEEKSFASAESRTQVVQPVFRHYTD